MTRYHAVAATRVGAAALTLLAGIWLAPEANAECVQSGNDVQCTGTDPDGFESTLSGITLTVQPGAHVFRDERVGVRPIKRLSIGN